MTDRAGHRDAPRRDRPLKTEGGAARHGAAPPRGQDSVAGAPGGRFGRMFGHLPACDPRDADIDALVAGMHGHSPPNFKIPAGYTYLGQFIDHDITFDPLSQLQRDNDPHALVNFRTPRFDLDSVYGSGPEDQPFLYDWDCRSHPGVRLLVGHNPPHSCLEPIDLPRNEQGRALVGDARNDENVIVAQLHLLLIAFHNKVVERVCHKQAGIASDELLAEAQRVVRWHYQWIVVHDFLKTIVGDIATKVLRPGARRAPETVERRFYHWRDEPFMPVEFSGATYRFGHSMVRDTYRLQEDEPRVPPFLPEGGNRHLGGRRRLPEGYKIDWDLFFFEGFPTEDRLHNRSQKLDTIIVPGLFRLPHGAGELPRLNLERGRALGLPSGPDVARAMAIDPLTHDEIAGLPAPYEPLNVAPLLELRERLPLWTYVLLEASVRKKGLRLGPVGGRIVAEVLVGLLEGDPSSYLRQWPTWKPELPVGQDGQFKMRDLIRYVEDPTLL